MANVNAPYGFKPWGPVLSQHAYTVNASTAVYRFDVVDLASTGLLQAASTTTSEVLLGSSSGYYAASATAIVYDDPLQQYHCQDYGDGTAPAQTDVGNQANHVATSADTTLLRSKHSLSGTHQTASNGFVILGLVQCVDNAWGQYCRMIVGLMESIRVRGQTGV